MGYAVHVDPDALAVGATALLGVAETIEATAGRLTATCAVAAAAAGGQELTVALELGARTGGAVIDRVADAVRAVGRATEGTAGDYRLQEQLLTRCWSVDGPADGTRS